MELPNDVCTSCYSKYEPADAFCYGCGYPLHGTQQEKDFFTSERNVKEIDLADLSETVRKACNSLYWIAGLLVISTIFGYATAQLEEDKMANLITGVILFVAFLGFGLWSKSKPAAALISGLSLYIIIHLLSAIINPVSIFSGIIIKVIIIVYLIKGIRSVLEVDKLKKELNIS